MQFAAVLLLGLSTNLDNLIIGAMVGIQGTRVPPLYNGLIALGSALAGFLCCALSTLFVDLGRTANLVGGVLLMVLGGGALIGAWRKKGEGCPQDVLTDIGVRQAILLSGSLALNCLAPAFAAGLTGTPPLAAGLAIGLFSYLSVGIGGWLGRKTRARLRCKALEVASALMMMGLGAMEIFF